MKGVRLLSCLLLLAAVTSCTTSPGSDAAAAARAAEASRSAEASRNVAALRTLEEARDLASGKRYDEAIAADLRLAGELKDGDSFRQALGDAVEADNDKMDGKDFLAQVAMLKSFCRQVPSVAATSQIVTGHVHAVLIGYPARYLGISHELVDNRERFVRDVRGDGRGQRVTFGKALGPTITPQQFRDVAAAARALGEPDATARLFIALADVAPGLGTYAEVDSTLDRTHTTSERILARLDEANRLVRAKLPAAQRALEEAR